uniref:Reverse transcriptase domain-containing protein n=1 Tax=Nicotiana tabacum TaxID=4097 RepID=A0A1S3X2S8_TOBAC|nr:PREDICTED: uncharacterized protein LOC107760632 [Nicotiana tabacum]
MDKDKAEGEKYDRKTLTLWGDLAEIEGELLESIENSKPVIAFCDVKSLLTQGDEKIAKKAVKYFQSLFNLTPPTINIFILDCIPSCISREDNDMLNKIPIEKEIKDFIFSLSPHSTAGPDGFNGTFFQSCWDIIQKEVTAFVIEFFTGKGLTKLYSHTCLVLILKIDNPATFADFRPISLSNFTKKIIYKIISIGVNTLFHKLVSLIQNGFVKDRLISENVLLAQEIIHNIPQINKDGNVVIKLDMAKTYDSMSWDFIYDVLRKFEFSDSWILIIHNLFSNVWYSIIVNDTRQGFFSSSRELKQGDPLSPSLFIIVVEVLSRSLNCLYRNPNFIPFSNHANVPKINHLAYAYDIIIFCSSDSISVKLIMNTISKYERSSAQLVNGDKIYFLTAPNTAAIRINMIRNCLGFMDKTFTFSYLGCPLYVRRKKIDYFDSMLSNIVKRLNGWQGLLGLFRPGLGLREVEIADSVFFVLKHVYWLCTWYGEQKMKGMISWVVCNKHSNSRYTATTQQQTNNHKCFPQSTDNQQQFPGQRKPTDGRAPNKQSQKRVVKQQK